MLKSKTNQMKRNNKNQHLQKKKGKKKKPQAPKRAGSIESAQMCRGYLQYIALTSAFQIDFK